MKFQRPGATFFFSEGVVGDWRVTSHHAVYAEMMNGSGLEFEPRSHDDVASWKAVKSRKLALLLWSTVATLLAMDNNL